MNKTFEQLLIEVITKELQNSEHAVVMEEGDAFVVSKDYRKLAEKVSKQIVALHQSYVEKEFDRGRQDMFSALMFMAAHVGNVRIIKDETIQIIENQLTTSPTCECHCHNVKNHYGGLNGCACEIRSCEHCTPTSEQSSSTDEKEEK